jgi:hypothetical protein
MARIRFMAVSPLEEVGVSKQRCVCGGKQAAKKQ